MATVIIIIVVIFLIKFIYDNNQQNTKVSTEGGMRKKYSVLIGYIIQVDNRVRILKETSNSIDLGIANAGGATSFFLTQTFGNLTVQWKMQNPIFGKHNLEWDFPEYLNQEKMIERIENDLGEYQSKLMGGKGY